MTVKIIETRSGKPVKFQDDDARKSWEAASRTPLSPSVTMRTSMLPAGTLTQRLGRQQDAWVQAQSEVRKLLEAIDSATEMFGAEVEDLRQLSPPFRLLSLSATGQNVDEHARRTVGFVQRISVQLHGGTEAV